MNIRHKFYVVAGTFGLIGGMVPVRAENICAAPVIESLTFEGHSIEIRFGQVWVKSLPENSAIKIDAITREPEGGEVERSEQVMQAVSDRYSLPLSKKDFAARKFLKVKLSAQAQCSEGSLSPIAKQELVVNIEPGCSLDGDTHVKYQQDQLGWSKVDGALGYEVCRSTGDTSVWCAVTEVSEIRLNGEFHGGMATITPICQKGRGVSKTFLVDMP